MCGTLKEFTETVCWRRAEGKRGEEESCWSSQCESVCVCVCVSVCVCVERWGVRLIRGLLYLCVHATGNYSSTKCQRDVKNNVSPLKQTVLPSVCVCVCVSD